MKIYVLYHANCRDGFGAKFAAWEKFRSSAEYIPVQYGKPMPEIRTTGKFSELHWGEQFFDPFSGETYHKINKSEAVGVSGGDAVEGHTDTFEEDEEVSLNVAVYICDFSYSKEELEALRDRVSTLVVLDHHKTAEEALRGFQGAEIVFDMNRSGAVIAWNYFHPGVKVPEILLHIQDRDLWKFNLHGTNEVHASLLMMGDDLTAMEALAEDDDMGRYFLKAAKEAGAQILKYEQKHVEGAVKNVKVLPYKGYKVGVYNTTTLVSELGHTVCHSEELGVDFSMSYFLDTDGTPILSFRSKGEFDVAKLAKELGGGGHKNAAGARVTLDFLGQLYQGKL